MIGSHFVSRKRLRSLQRETQRIFPVLLAILVGGGVGVLAIIANNVATKWAVAIVIAVVAPSVVLLVNDIKKLILIAFIVDMPLGIDIAIQNQGWHKGGPTGYMVSLGTIALVVGYALWIIEQRPKPRSFPKVTIPALLYLFTVVLSLYQCPNFQLGLFGLFLLCQFILIYFYIVNHVQTWADLRLIILTVTVCLLLESALMVMQYFTGAALDVGIVTSTASDGATSAGATFARVGGTIGSPNMAAIYLTSMLVITFGAYLTDNLVDKRLALMAFSLGVIALIATGTRGGWGAFIVAMLILLSYAVRTEAGRRAALLLLVGGLFVAVLFGGQIQTRLETAKAASRDRQELAVMAYNIMKDYPLGVGENNYDQVMSDKYAHPNYVGHTLYVVHNKYLLIWTEKGPQGLAAFILLLVASAWQARRWLFRTGVAPHLSILAASLLGALAGYAFHVRSEGIGLPQAFWFIVTMTIVVNHLISQEEPVHSEESVRVTFHQSNGNFTRSK